MDNTRIDIYKQFAKSIEYPMVIFEAESGEVLFSNSEAEILLGTKAKNIRIEPGRALTTNNFWDLLHGRKSMIWHRIRLTADDNEILVSGLVHEMMVDDQLIYTVLFERRADLNIGSVTLERIVNHAGIVAVHLIKDEEGYQVDYVSQNINRYGYTRAQLYEKLITTDEIVCDEDIETVKNEIRVAIGKKISENAIECRVLTEQRQLIPVRLLIHYVYNDYGNLTDFEILVLDLTEELRKNRETGYLHSAIAKMKSVVLVKTYKDEQRSLRYVSPNAAMLGMNVEALQKGYKLTEDYIHPQDRDEVIDSIYQAVSNGVTDYVKEYRMVRDDGKRIWVENDVTVNRVAEGEMEIAFLLTDITERKELEQELAMTSDTNVDMEADSKLLDEFVGASDEDDSSLMSQFQAMADVVCAHANYYSVLLDLSAKQLIRPVGPSNDMGLFYDLFERPEFRESFPDISQRAIAEKIPQSVSFYMDQFHVNLIFAPIMVEDNVNAFWVMASFAPNGSEVLNEVAHNQWKLVNSIAKCFNSEQQIEKEVRLRKLADIALHKEQNERKVIEELIATLAKDGIAGVGSMCQSLGDFLGVSYVGVYKEGAKGDFESFYTWSKLGIDNSLFDRMAISASEYQAVKLHFEDDGVLVVDKSVEEGFLKGLVTKTGMGAIMLVDVRFSNDSCGYIMIADEDMNREFDKQTIHICKVAADLFGRVLFMNEVSPKMDCLSDGYFDAYNHIRDAVFVKENRRGEIVFANKSMDKLFGYSLVGMQAKEVVNDQMDQYRAMQGIRRRLIADKKVTKWQTYMKELDQIMNIVEVHLDTINGADLSLVIMKKNKNKDKKKD